MKILLNITTLLAFLFLSSFSNENMDELAYIYVDNYQELAVVEMHRTGVPASITLAQGLHETNHGTSKLSLEANNHFGIKCKKFWQGQYYYHKDDDRDTSGVLIPSCFRAYNSYLESFVDHSNYLVTTKYYASLFKYAKTDYKSWALGLKQCGYATDPSYAEKLIDKIEKYNLSQYDQM
jgi:flagellum-specific peptidoglycan hydrolase FlgJ